MRIILYFLILFFKLNFAKGQCSNYDNNYNCGYEEHDFPESFDNNCFQTPPRNDIFGRYKNSYQDMHYFVGYAQLKYSNDLQSCEITFYSKVNPILGTINQDYKIIYKFVDIEQNSNTFTVTSTNSYPKGLPISAQILDNDNNHLVELILENEYFIWEHPQINLPSNYENGQKGVIVELLGWPFEDIAEECEFLADAGYLGVKIYSPNEHLLTYRSTNDGELNDLDFIFHPVSYKLESRMGDKHQLNYMINICRAKGIRVYAELVINHMTSIGEDSYENHINNDCSTWGPKEGSAGSPFWTIKGLNKNNPYTKSQPAIEFPAVPYFMSDFHCYSYIEYNELDKDKMNYGYLYNLVDLNTQKDYVRQRIADFFTELISIGISGFTFNSVVNVPPTDYVKIFSKLKENLGNKFPEDFLVYMQIDLWGDRKDIFVCNNNYNEYNFAEGFQTKMENEGFSENDINKIKIWSTGYPNNNFPICNDGIWKISPERWVLGLSNHHIQTPSGTDPYLKDKNLEEHKNQYIQLLSDITNNWKIKFIFSGYSIMNNGGYSFPDGKSDCSKCITNECSTSCTKSVLFQKAYNPLSTGYDPGNGEDNWKEGTYTRVHRNIEIVNAMRSWMNLNPFENENNLFQNEKPKVICPINCKICNEESNNLNKCIFCNSEQGYYPIYNDNIERYKICVHNSEHENYYFDEKNNRYLSCYEICKTCEKEGNEIFHNCLTCKDNYKLIETGKYKGNCMPIYKINITVPYYIVVQPPTEIITERPTEKVIPSTEIQNKPITEITTEVITEMDTIKTTISVTHPIITKFEETEHIIFDPSQCFKEGKLLIKEKKICVNDCKNDDLYQYKYSGNCFQNCPNNTNNDNFICKEITVDKCTLSENEIELDNFSEKGGISSIAKTYSEEYSYTINHVTKFKNDEYEFICYKNVDCIEELSLDIPKIDFGECYNKVKDYYSIKENLTIVTLTKYYENNHVTTHSFYNPITYEKLNASQICENETIQVEEDIFSILKEKNVDYDNLMFFINQNIDIFNTSHEFYTDICYDFDSPLNKDITLKDRMLAIFPNVTLCEKNCQSKGVNLTTMTAICECKFNDIINNDLLKENVLISSATDEIFELISQSNLQVLKCYKYIFKYFIKLSGGYIVSILIIIHIILSFIYYKVDLLIIKKYIFNLTEKYLSFLKKKNNENKFSKINIPPKKKVPIKKSVLRNKLKKNSSKSTINYKSAVSSSQNKHLKSNTTSEKLNKFETNKNLPIKYKDNINKKYYRRKTTNENKIDSKNNLKSFAKNNLKIYSKKNLKSYSKKTKNIDINLEEFDFNDYLEPSLDDLDFDDALKKDKRKFCNHFFETIKEKQIIANTFFVNDALRPKTIKIMLFNLNLILYFVINGLFFSEDYVSEVYHLEKEDTFFSFFPRSIERFIYTTIVSLVINVIVECFMVNENKIKGIYIREKDNELNLKYEISLLMKRINNSILLFILVSFILYLLFFYYLLCFNYVYPCMQIEWIKSSITIVIIMQLLSILSCFIQSSLRFLSFKCKSEKMYKISRILD